MNFSTSEEAAIFCEFGRRTIVSRQHLWASHNAHYADGQGSLSQYPGRAERLETQL
jgi:hypothetical protein